jgi:hypothetical protein
VGAIGYWVPDTQSEGQRQTIEAYLQAFTGEGNLVLDPFCKSAELVQAATTAGRRVIAVSSNPLDALRTRVALLAVPPRDIDSAITRIADSPKSGLSLREHLARLHRTTCPRCGKPTAADYFVWERGEDLPRQVYYSCPACGATGLKNREESDSLPLQEIEPRGLHYWYILDRIVSQEGNARKLAASLLELYTPRSLYTLSNLQLKIEALFSGTPMYDVLRLGLLHALERGSKLNPVPGEPVPAHAPALRVPQRYAEWNVWSLFEQALQSLAQQQPALQVALEAQPLGVTAAASPGGRAFVGHLPVRQLVSAVSEASAHLVWVHAPPLGRTHWALPYLWTGFLFASKVAAPLWPLVRRRSSDWPWYLSVMRSTLGALGRTLHQDGRLVLVGPSKGLAFHETVTMAAAGAGLQLETSLYHSLEPELATKPFGGLRGDYRSTWRPSTADRPAPVEISDLLTRCREATVLAARELLQARAEPTSFARLHSYIWEALAKRQLLKRALSIQDLEFPLEWIRQQVTAALQNAVGTVFVQLWQDDSKEECLWWLQHPDGARPLSERVEESVCDLLESSGPLDTRNLLQLVYDHFPEELTPDESWVNACLTSYGNAVAPGRWQINPSDGARARKEIRHETLALLQSLGQGWGLGCRQYQNQAVVFWTLGGEDTIALVVLDSAAVSVLIGLTIPETVKSLYAIIPDVRLDLVRARLARSPALRRAIGARGCKFIHDQDLVHWASQHDTRFEDLDSIVSLDPLTTEGRGQLPLL